MNILIVSEVDYSGAAEAMRAALSQHTKHRVRAVSFKRHRLRYGFDVLNPSAWQFNELMNWADMVNVHEQAIRRVGNIGKPIVRTYHGSWYRQNRDAIDRAYRKHVQTCLTIDLSSKRVKWIGRPVPRMQPNRQDGTFVFVHAPTQRHRKGTGTVLKAFHGFDLDLVERRTNQECLRHKARAHVLIDQVGAKGLGYGTNAVEAWAIGMPVVSSAPDWIVERMKRAWGYVPFVRVVGKDDLREVMLRLRDDADYYDEWMEIGVRHYERFHAPEAFVERFLGEVTTNV